MKLEIRKMKPDDRNQVSKIYDEGTDSGNANFEVTLPHGMNGSRNRCQDVVSWLLRVVIL